MSDEAQATLEKIQKWADAHAGDWPFRDAFGGILRATFARATKTFAAGVTLTGRGYGPQAMMLARPLVEDAIVAYWSVWVKEPQFVVERLVDQATYFSGHIRRKTMEAHPRIFGEVPPSDGDSLRPDRERCEALFGRHANVSWWANDIEEVPDPKPGQRRYKVVCSRTPPILIKELEVAARAKHGTEESILTIGALVPLIEDMRAMYDVVQRSGNVVLHNTGLSVLKAFDEKTESWREGPAPDDWLPEAQGSLYLAYEKLIYLMCDRFNPALIEDYLAANADGFKAFVPDASDPAPPTWGT